MNTEIFTGKAEAYARARPGYPDAAIDHIVNLAPKSAIFTDVGAGTGKFTELIARKGYSIFAVEPNSDMLEQLAVTIKPYPNAKVVVGSAEATTLPDHSVDIIVCAQSLNWFDIELFRAECKRIGRPGCIVAVIYNKVPGINKDLRNKKSTDALFTNPLVKEFPNPIIYDREKWLLYMTSHAGVPSPSDPGYIGYVAEMNTIFDMESINGVLRHDVMTITYSEKVFCLSD